MPAASSPLVLLVSNTAWSIANFRGRLIECLQNSGYQVAALAPDSGLAIRLPCELIPLRMERKALSPMSDALLLLRLIQVFKRRRPFSVLTFTPKPNIYGAIAARICGAKVISNVSGLGSGFLRGRLLLKTLHRLYRIANRSADAVFFQNADDLAYFEERRLVDPRKAVLVPGSGVDLERYQPGAAESETGFVLLLIARLLGDKGIYEFVEAARRVRLRYPYVRFQILGQFDPANPSAIGERELRTWVDEGTIEYLGWVDDVRPLIAASNCVVLPSYREGTPRTLLEAAAMARPIIAADAPGCRQVVEHGRTGYLCRVRDPGDLAEKMSQMIRLPRVERIRLGMEGRRKMEREFDETLVIDRYLQSLQGFRSWVNPQEENA